MGKTERTLSRSSFRIALLTAIVLCLLGLGYVLVTSFAQWQLGKAHARIEELLMAERVTAISPPIPVEASEAPSAVSPAAAASLPGEAAGWKLLEQIRDKEPAVREAVELFRKVMSSSELGDLPVAENLSDIMNIATVAAAVTADSCAFRVVDFHLRTGEAMRLHELLLLHFLAAESKEAAERAFNAFLESARCFCGPQDFNQNIQTATWQLDCLPLLHWTRAVVLREPKDNDLAFLDQVAVALDALDDGGELRFALLADALSTSRHMSEAALTPRGAQQFARLDRRGDPLSPVLYRLLGPVAIALDQTALLRAYESLAETALKDTYDGLEQMKGRYWGITALNAEMHADVNINTLMEFAAARNVLRETIILLLIQGLHLRHPEEPPSMERLTEYVLSLGLRPEKTFRNALTGKDLTTPLLRQAAHAQLAPQGSSEQRIPEGGMIIGQRTL